MCEKISDILSTLNIDDLYTQNFINNGFHNLSQCLEINEEILKDIGVDKPGHRRRIIKYFEQSMTTEYSEIETQKILQNIPPPEEVCFNKLNVLNMYHKDDDLDEDNDTNNDSVFTLNKTFELPSPLQLSNTSKSESYDILLSPPAQFKDVDETDEGIYDNVPSEVPEVSSVDSISLDTGTNTQSLNSYDNGSYDNIVNTDGKQKVSNQSLITSNNNKVSEKNTSLKSLSGSCYDNAPQKFPSEPNILKKTCSHIKKNSIREVESVHNLSESQNFTYQLPLKDFNNYGDSLLENRKAEWKTSSTKSFSNPTASFYKLQEELPRTSNSISCSLSSSRLKQGKSLENLKADENEVIVKSSPKSRKKALHKKSRPISAFFKESLLSVAGNTRHNSASDKLIPSPTSPLVLHSSRQSPLRTLVNIKKSVDTTSEENVTYDLLSKTICKEGWLFKNSGQMQKKWVVFDGEELKYYENNTKLEISKSLIPSQAIKSVKIKLEDSKSFIIGLKDDRQIIFTCDTKTLCSEWIIVLNYALERNEKLGQGFSKTFPGVYMHMPYKQGFLKIDGTKYYIAIKGDKMAYYKSENDFNFGKAISRLEMKFGKVSPLSDKKKFQLVFHFKTFTVTAESENDKVLWMDAFKEAIQEGLSDYKAFEMITPLKGNHRCADCGCLNADWCSINLAIVICKHCAGVHRDLGVHNSKVRSIKMDELRNSTIKMLKEIGNEVANKFWVSSISETDKIKEASDKKQRAWHISSKYIESRYISVSYINCSQHQLNSALIEGICQQNYFKVYSLVFSGADVNCHTNKTYATTPFILAKHLKYEEIAEFLEQNGATSQPNPEGHVTERIANGFKRTDSVNHRPKPSNKVEDHLYKYGGDFRHVNETSSGKRGLNIIKSALQQGDFQRRWCVLEKNKFKYFDAEKQAATVKPKDEIDSSELLGVGLCQPEQATKAGMKNCFEVSRNTGRTYLFSCLNCGIALKWIRALMEEICPPYVLNCINESHDRFQRVGKILMRTQHVSKKGSLAQDWKPTWCVLKNKTLHYFHQDYNTLEPLDLRRIIQLARRKLSSIEICMNSVEDDKSQATSNSLPIKYKKQKDVAKPIMVVFKKKTYYFWSETPSDSESWFLALQRADSLCGPNIEDHQLSTSGAPVVLEKCITYVEQYGLEVKGIYRLSGQHSKTTSLLEKFNKNARETSVADVNVHDVTNALKRWFKTHHRCLMTSKLYSSWVDTAALPEEKKAEKILSYKQLLSQLPKLNQTTLKLLLNHLNTVAKHESINEMSQKNLAIVFGPTLMSSIDHTDQASTVNLSSMKLEEEISCIKELLNNFEEIFEVTEVDKQREREFQKAQMKMQQASNDQLNTLTNLDYEMLVPIYIENKSQCFNYKVNMVAGLLVWQICSSFPHLNASKYSLYEVMFDGSCERVVHHNEHVLHVIKMWKLPSSNYLILKQDYMREKLRWCSPNNPVNDQILMTALKMYDSKKKWVKLQGFLKLDEDDRLYLELTKNSDALNGRWRKKVIHSVVEIASEMSPENRLRSNSLLSSLKQNVIKQTNGMTTRLLTSSLFSGKSNANRMIKVPSQRSKSVQNTPEKSKLKFQKPNSKSRKGKAPINSIYLDKYNIYLGVDKKTKPPNKSVGFMLLCTEDESEKHFCCENNDDLYKWLAQVMLYKHKTYEFPSSMYDKESIEKVSKDFRSKIDLSELEASVASRHSSASSLLAPSSSNTSSTANNIEDSQH